MLNMKKNQDMRMTNSRCRQWLTLLILLVWLPINGHAQTTRFEMVVEKTDGTELTFQITDDYPVLSHQYGGEEGINRLYITGESDATEIPCENIKRLFTREVQAALGDANDDGKVTIADGVCIVNYLMGNPPADFNTAAADVDGDGQITIADAVGVVNIILNK